MATNVFAGRAGVLFAAAGATSSGAQTRLGAVRNFTLTYDMSDIDATSFDSSGYKQVIDGVKAWKFSCEALVLSTAAGNYANQNAFRVSFKAGTRKYVNFQNSTGATASGRQSFAGFAYISKWEQKGTVTDIQLHNFELTGDGPLVEA